MINRKRLHEGKKKAKKRTQDWCSACRGFSEKEILRFRGLHRKTTKLCSCHLGCGNSRKLGKGKDKLTNQEKKQKLKEQHEED